MEKKTLSKFEIIYSRKAEPLGDIPVETEMSDACVAQWLEQSTGNRKTRARIPAQSKASFFPQKDFKFFKFEFYLLF